MSKEDLAKTTRNTSPQELDAFAIANDYLDEMRLGGSPEASSYVTLLESLGTLEGHDYAGQIALDAAVLTSDVDDCVELIGIAQYQLDKAVTGEVTSQTAHLARVRAMYLRNALAGYSAVLIEGDLKATGTRKSMYARIVDSVLHFEDVRLSYQVVEENGSKVPIAAAGGTGEAVAWALYERSVRRRGKQALTLCLPSTFSQDEGAESVGAPKKVLNNWDLSIFQQDTEGVHLASKVQVKTQPDERRIYAKDINVITLSQDLIASAREYEAGGASVPFIAKELRHEAAGTARGGNTRRLNIRSGIFVELAEAVNS